MRYTALLQRFDTPQVEVACGDGRHEVVTAATAIYTALVPSILRHGEDAVRREVAAELAAPAREEAMSSRLRVQEWGIAVMDSGAPLDLGATDKPPIAEMIFWLGATRERVQL